MPIRTGEIMISLLLAVLIPPYTIYSRNGSCNGRLSFGCVFLMILGYIPGFLYVVYIIITEDIVGANQEVFYRNLPHEDEDSTTIV